MRRAVLMRGPAFGLRCVACRAGRLGSLRPALQSKMADLWSARAGYGLREASADACGGRGVYSLLAARKTLGIPKHRAN